MFNGATCLITGGTGSWGQELTRQLLGQNATEIRILSRNEFAQVQMQRRFQDARLKFSIGDVRDYEAVSGVMSGVDYVFHLAALKHVPICEMQPEEALKTNVVGTKHVIDASVRHGVKKVIDVSTDKAVDSLNFYGMTKAIGERMMLIANERESLTRFVCIRGGNVLGTNGSVVPLFRKQILVDRHLTITHQDMTRYFLTVGEAIRLLLKAAEVSVGGETFVMKMRACRIEDLARVMVNRLATAEVTVQEVGMRPGEKLHEVLISRYESTRTKKYDDQYYVILPMTENLEHAVYQCLESVQFDEYNSTMELMGDDEIEEMLEHGGFLV